MSEAATPQGAPAPMPGESDMDTAARRMGGYLDKLERRSSPPDDTTPQNDVAKSAPRARCARGARERRRDGQGK